MEIDYIDFGDDTDHPMVIRFDPRSCIKIALSYEDDTRKRDSLLSTLLHMAYEQGKRKERTGNGRPGPKVDPDREKRIADGRDTLNDIHEAMDNEAPDGDSGDYDI